MKTLSAQNIVSRIPLVSENPLASKFLSGVVIAMCLSSFCPAVAQLALGGRVGINFAAEPFKNYTHEFLARPYIGALANYRLKNAFAFQAELNVSGEGSTVKVPSTGILYKDRQTYLNVPLLVQYRFTRTYLEAGPQFGFLISANRNYIGQKFNDKDSYKGSATGFMIGVGREIKRTLLGSFGINLRYMRTLSVISKTNSGLVGGDEIKNRVLSVGFTYKWEVTN